MADTFLFRNNAVSTLLAGITASDLTIFLATGEGALFPTPAVGQIFSITLTNASGDIEILYCSAQPNADELVVTRGEELTTPRIWLAGDAVGMRITRGILEQILQADGLVLADANADTVDGQHASATAEANKLLALDAGLILQAIAANSLLLEGQNSAYHRSRGNHTGTQSVDAFLGRVGTEVIPATGTFTVPANITKIDILGFGGGGGGGGGGDGTNGLGSSGEGGRGGGRGVGRRFTINVAGGEVFDIAIGAGGAGGLGVNDNDGTAGSAGDDSIISMEAVVAGSLIVGHEYRILTTGTTDFTLVGAATNVIGTIFIATGVGIGDGTVTRIFIFSAGTGGAGGLFSNFGGTAGQVGYGGASNGYFALGGVGGPGGTATGVGGDPGFPPATFKSYGELGGGAGGGGGGGGGKVSPGGGDGGGGAPGFILFSW